MTRPANFDEHIKQLAIFVREELAKVDSIHTVDFSIDISGRTHDGELNIEYGIGGTYSTGGKVKGGKLEAIIREYKRRFGWDEINKPLALSFNGETVIDEEVL